MTLKEKQLAGDLLRLAADEFGNHGCNDWTFPGSWTIEEREALLKDYYRWNGDPENYSPGGFISDFAIMEYMAHKLKVEP